MGNRTLIGPYVVQSELGRGGMGVVYLARDDRLDRQVAIKTLPAEFTRDRERLRRLKHEAKVVARLNHPHIAQIHHLMEHEGATFLVLEYVPGQSLSELIDTRGPLPIDEACRVGAQIARAMEAAHRKGVIHRDLKPDNVRVMEDGTVKVVDFGIAQAGSRPVADPKADTVTGLGLMIGTPGYMAPEQARGEAIDARADVLSFGCVLYECLTGRPALEGRSAAERIAATLACEPDLSQLPPEVPNSIHSLVRRCLERDPLERVRDMGDVCIILDDVIGTRRPTSPRSVEVPSNLPLSHDRFIGRERDLAELSALLNENRLVSLTGAGGCGKTRLAVELGRRITDRFADGVVFVELAPSADPRLVPSAVANALGVKPQPGLPLTDVVCGFLSGKTAVLIVDNCEHVLEGASALVVAILDAAPQLHVVATSRQPLGVSAETTWRVPSLSLPPDRPDLDLASTMASESVDLFLDRARAVRPAFALTKANAPAVAGICHRLDGIPLAIELAATRIKVLAPAQILSRLQDRFRLLRAGRRGVIERHRTLRAAVDWSYQMLSDVEKRMLQALCVFAGRFTLDAAVAISGPGGGADCADLDEFEVLDLMTHLVDKSLVVVDDIGDEAYYRLLETVRQYAAEELENAGETGTARRRHVDYYWALGRAADSALAGPEQREWLDRLDMDLDNLLEAIAWGATARATSVDDVESPLTKALGLGSILHRFWEARGHYVAALTVLEPALAAGKDANPVVRARALYTAGFLTYRQGNHDRAEQLLKTALPISAGLGDQIQVSRLHNILGGVAFQRGQLDVAWDRFGQALDLARDVQDKERVAVYLGNLGELAAYRGELDTGRDLLEQSLDIAREQGNNGHVAAMLSKLGMVGRMRGDLAEARGRLAEALALCAELENTWLFPEMLDQVAVVAICQGEPGHAARLLGAAGAIRDQTGAPREGQVRREIESHLAKGMAALRKATATDNAWEMALTEGAQLSTVEAVSEALRWLDLAHEG